LHRYLQLYQRSTRTALYCRSIYFTTASWGPLEKKKKSGGDGHVPSAPIGKDGPETDLVILEVDVGVELEQCVDGRVQTSSHGHQQRRLATTLALNTTTSTHKRRTVSFYRPTVSDTTRYAISTCARKPTRVRLIYRTEPTTKKWKTENLKSRKTDMLRSIGNMQSDESM